MDHTAWELRAIAGKSRRWHLWRRSLRWRPCVPRPGVAGKRDASGLRHKRRTEENPRPEACAGAPEWPSVPRARGRRTAHRQAVAPRSFLGDAALCRLPGCRLRMAPGFI